MFVHAAFGETELERRGLEMNMTLKRIVFFSILLSGVIFFYVFGRMFNMYAALLTGQGWFFSFGPWLWVSLFVGIMVWKFWPRSDA